MVCVSNRADLNRADLNRADLNRASLTRGLCFGIQVRSRFDLAILIFIKSIIN